MLMPFKPVLNQSPPEPPTLADSSVPERPPQISKWVPVDIIRRYRRQVWFGFGAVIALVFLSTLFILRSNIGALLASVVPKTSSDLARIQKTASTSIQQKESSPSTGPATLDSDRPFNLLILGIDRRHSTDSSYRSDINILASFTPDRKKVVLTSIPRDLWIDGARINAFVTQEGTEATKNKVYQVTGLMPDRYIQADFDNLVEGVDALGGLDVDIKQSFTDTTYPNDRAGKEGVYTVTFEAGTQHLEGEPA